jgi:hypothetical protein
MLNDTLTQYNKYIKLSELQFKLDRPVLGTFYLYKAYDFFYHSNHTKFEAKVIRKEINDMILTYLS